MFPAQMWSDMYVFVSQVLSLYLIWINLWRHSKLDVNWKTSKIVYSKQYCRRYIKPMDVLAIVNQIWQTKLPQCVLFIGSLLVHGWWSKSSEKNNIRGLFRLTFTDECISLCDVDVNTLLNYNLILPLWYVTF